MKVENITEEQQITYKQVAPPPSDLQSYSAKCYKMIIFLSPWHLVTGPGLTSHELQSCVPDDQCPAIRQLFMSFSYNHMTEQEDHKVGVHFWEP